MQCHSTTQTVADCVIKGLVYRYDVKKADDGVGGEEGTFSLCTLWSVSHVAGSSASL